MWLQRVSLALPLDDVDVGEAGGPPGEVDPTRDSGEVDVFDDLYKGIRRPIAVEILEVGIIFLNQLFKCESVQPNCIIHIATKNFVFRLE